MVVGDCRLQVAEAMCGNFHLLAWDIGAESQIAWGRKLQEFAWEQAEKGQCEMAKQAAEKVKQLGMDGPDYQAAALQQGKELTQRLQCLWDEREARDCLRTGLRTGRAGYFDGALEKLQRGWELLEDVDDVELHLQLSLGMAETYCQAALWQDCVSLCQYILTTWGHSPHSFQLLQTLFYLTLALYSLHQFDQGYAAIEEWSGKLHAQDTCSKCAQLCIQANQLRFKDKKEEAEQLYEATLQLDPLLPSSLLAVGVSWQRSTTAWGRCRKQRRPTYTQLSCSLSISQRRSLS